MSYAGEKATDMTVFELLAEGAPAPGVAPEPALYERLVGSWAIECEWYSREGGVSSAHGAWHFAWILGGMGVQDVLFVDGAPPSQRGTSIRVLDPATGSWRVTWMQPATGEFVSLLGRAAGNDIVQEALSATGEPRMRWSFREITPDSFTWLGEISADGETWFLEQRMVGRRTA